MSPQSSVVEKYDRLNEEDSKKEEVVRSSCRRQKAQVSGEKRCRRSASKARQSFALFKFSALILHPNLQALFHKTLAIIEFLNTTATPLNSL